MMRIPGKRLGPMTRPEAEMFLNLSSSVHEPRTLWIAVLTADSQRLAAWIRSKDSVAATLAIAEAQTRSAVPGDPRVTQALAERMHTRHDAALALGRGRDRRAIPTLCRLLEDRNADEKARLDAASYLIAMHEPAMARRLQSLSEQLPDSGGRRLIDLVARLGDPRCIEIARAGLRDPYHGVRAHAALALGMLKDKTAVPALVRALNDPYADVRRDAAQALAHIGDRAAVRALRRAVTAQNGPLVPYHSAGEAQEAARQALRALARAHP